MKGRSPKKVKNLRTGPPPPQHTDVSRDQSTPPPSITPTEESVAGSDFSAGFNDVLSSLQSLRREIDGESITPDGTGNEGGVASSSQGQSSENSNLRHRT